MMCSCGGITKDHEYQTKDGVKHEVSTCKACGRRREIDWENGEKIREKG